MDIKYVYTRQLKILTALVVEKMDSDPSDKSLSIG